jgi:hypothetical protein
MRAFPGVADHWHIGTNRSGRFTTSAERVDKATARKMVRDLLVNDGRQTRDHHGYSRAIAIIDAGWCSAKVNGLQYVAFACACPELPRKETNDGSDEISEVVKV